MRTLMRGVGAAAFLGCCALAAGVGFGGEAQGVVVYENDFSPAALEGWKLGTLASVEEVDGRRVLRVHADEPRKDNKIVVPFDIIPHRGKFIRLSARVRHQNVTKPRHRWNGTKLMLAFSGQGGGRQYHHPQGRHGDADWTEIHTLFRVDEEAKDAMLHLGLEDSAGTIWFDRLRIERFEIDGLYPPVAAPDYRPVYTDRVSMPTTWRGVMSPSSFRADRYKKDFADLRAWKANLIRWQIVRNWGKTGSDRDIDEYLSWIDERIEELRLVLDEAAKHGIKVVVDLHVLPGGRLGTGEFALFHEAEYKEAFLETWRRIVRAVKGHAALYGYDLFNEPSQLPGASFDYLALQYEVGEAVRAIDPDTPLIVEALDWDSPHAFRQMHPIPLDNVIYQVHIYQPMSFTHMGVNGRPMAGAYPGVFDGARFDKDSLRQVMRPVREFQEKYGAKIYMGEFSAARWAPAAERYLDDVLALAEEYGWDWTYHAFREWSGWSVEHGEDPADDSPAAVDTERKKVLLHYLRRNDTPRPPLSDAPAKASASEASAMTDKTTGKETSSAGLAAAPATVDPAGMKSIKVVETTTAARKYRVLFLGNSITRHGPNAGLRWMLDAGMAASAPENDYVHRFRALAEKRLPEGMGMETMYLAVGGGKLVNHFDRQAEWMAAAPDLVVVQLGENERADGPDGLEAFARDYAKLLDQVLSIKPKPAVICVGVWMPGAGEGEGAGVEYAPGPHKDSMVREAARARGLPFASVARYATDPACRGFGENPGVKWHPNDQGMSGYAEALAAVWTPPAVDGRP